MNRSFRRSITLAGFGVVLLLGVATFDADARNSSPPTGSPIAPASPCAAQSSASLEATSLAGQAISTSGTVTISLTDHGFSPSYVESTNGHPLTITLTNIGSRPHGFTMTRFDIAETLAPGETKTIVIEQPDLGDFPYVSNAPCDDGMQGLLVFYI